MSWQELCEKSDKRVMELEAELEAVKQDRDAWKGSESACNDQYDKLYATNTQLIKERDALVEAAVDADFHCWGPGFTTPEKAATYSSRLRNLYRYPVPGFLSALEARVKRYEDASDPGKLHVLIAQFVCESDSGPEWMRKLADKISASMLEVAKADSDPNKCGLCYDDKPCNFDTCPNESEEVGHGKTKKERV